MGHQARVQSLEVTGTDVRPIRTPPPSACQSQPSCANKRGQCRESCNAWEDEKGVCGPGCICCGVNTNGKETHSCLSFGDGMERFMVCEWYTWGGERLQLYHGSNEPCYLPLPPLYMCSSLYYYCCCCFEACLLVAVMAAPTYLHAIIFPFLLITILFPSLSFIPMSNTHSAASPSVILEMEECVRVGGALKSSCSELEKPIAWGCSSSSRYCCCTPRDGKVTCHLLSPILHFPK